MRYAELKLKFLLASLLCFDYKETDYEYLMDQYEAIAREFTGFTLADLRGLSFRERKNWLERTKRFRG